ncbi:MAG: D-alanyl-D-alanine carboxypeptidase family protein [Oscillospiraceae bacterium]|jgi:D-alanyl-D-alanine carboxypeptidase (penicillin-binding protein 5/6)
MHSHRKLHIFTSLMLIFVLAFSSALPCSAADESSDSTADSTSTSSSESTSAEASASTIDLGYEPYSNAVYLVNLDTGRVVYEKNADERVYPASTTKIMSAAIALTMCSEQGLDPATTEVTVPEDVWAEFEGMNVSSIPLSGGEVLTMENLLYCMLVASGNEAASAVAAYFGRDEFISRMNQKAQELGCTGTHFSNPHGLYADDHYTTASDLYKIAAWAMTVPGFSEICSTYVYTLPATNMHSERQIVTTNYLINPYSGYYTSYVYGIKTGTIDESGRCLVSIAEKNGMTYILVLMGAPTETTSLVWENSNSVFNETRYIYDLVFSKAELTELVDEYTPVTEISVKYGSGTSSVVLYPAESVYGLISSDATVDPVITYEFDLPDELTAPVEEGQVVGTATVYADGYEAGTVDLVSLTSVEFSSFSKIMSTMSDILTSAPVMIVLGVIIVAVILYCYYMLVVVKRKQKEKEDKK